MRRRRIVNRSFEKTFGMKLASLRTSNRDGELVVVSRDLTSMVRAREIAPTLQWALDNWAATMPRLAERYRRLNERQEAHAEAFTEAMAHSPLPRAFQWCDGSVYLAHAERMAQWTGSPVADRFTSEPWMYQGASDNFLGPTENIVAGSEDWGIDYEAEIAVVTTDVPYGATPARGAEAIALIMLCNDVSLRNLIPPELAKGFGFVQSKPASAFSPVAITPEELGDSWTDWRVHGRVSSYVNGILYGDPDAGEMLHGFDRLIAHVAKTRALAAGSIIGSGTIANIDPLHGTSCLVERRVLETLEHGAAITPFLHFGDTVRIEMRDRNGGSMFGAIEQTVVQLA
jgi:fumarylacetoacetate (FAA) hydrolase